MSLTKSSDTQDLKELASRVEDSPRARLHLEMMRHPEEVEAYNTTLGRLTDCIYYFGQWEWSIPKRKIDIAIEFDLYIKFRGIVVKEQKCGQAVVRASEDLTFRFSCIGRAE